MTNGNDASQPSQPQAAAAVSRLIEAGIRPGAMRHRWDRPVKNGRWYARGTAVVAKVGWGDLALGDLHGAGAALGAGWGFVVLPENPPGGVHLHATATSADQGEWCRYDKPDHSAPTVTRIAEATTFAALDGELMYVDRLGLANRAGNVWISPGHRYTRTGRFIRSGAVRFPAVSPSDLAVMLIRLVGVDQPAIDAVESDRERRRDDES